MPDEEALDLQLTITLEDTDQEDLDRQARQLLREIDELDVESAGLAQGGPPPVGAKGEGALLGSIMVTVLPAVMPALLEVITSWVKRSQGRSVKFKGSIGGTLFEFEGPTAEFKALLDQIGKTPPPEQPPTS
jgi:hypothetical protein